MKLRDNGKESSKRIKLGNNYIEMNFCSIQSLPEAGGMPLLNSTQYFEGYSKGDIKRYLPWLAASCGIG
jgi:hypothetical protein